MSSADRMVPWRNPRRSQTITNTWNCGCSFTVAVGAEPILVDALICEHGFFFVRAGATELPNEVWAINAGGAP